MTSKRRIACCVVAAGALGAVLWPAGVQGGRASTKPVGYIVCGNEHFRDQRVYQVDFVNGGVTGMSEPIDWMGNPQHLAIDAGRARLYIGSFRGKARDYYPMTVVSMRDGEFEVANRFTTHPEDTLPRDSRRRNRKPYEVYQIVLSPDGNELHVAHGGLSEGMLRAVWDANTGEVLRELEHYVRPADVWSPDGRYVAEIWPGSDAQMAKEGETAKGENTAGVDVRDVQTGKRVSLTWLEDGKGLHPPWGRIGGPLIRVHGTGRVLAHDRDSGKVVSEFNVDELTGLYTLGGVLWQEPLVLADKHTAVLPMFDSERTFVVAVHVLRPQEVSRTAVGANCTNPVAAYE